MDVDAIRTTISTEVYSLETVTPQEKTTPLGKKRVLPSGLLTHGLVWFALTFPRLR